jgi:glycosyltransferase involved in cell wall biosynthesis
MHHVTRFAEGQRKTRFLINHENEVMVTAGSNVMGIMARTSSAADGEARAEKSPSGFRLWRTRQVLKKLLRIPLGIHYQYSPRPMQLPRSYYRAPATQPSLAFSIVTPSLNQGAFLEKTLQSVLTQNYPHLEYIVQDGGSTDDTLAILARYRAKLKHCASAWDRGQAHAINLGFQHATGEVLAYLNSDDLLLPGTLHYVADFFARNPLVDVVYGHRVMIDADDVEVGRWVLPRHDNEFLRWADFVPQETLFWRRRIWDKVGGSLDESFHYALDWDLLLRFLDAGARFARLPRFLGAFRLHPEQKTSLQMFNLGVPEMKRLCLRTHGRAVSHRQRYRKIVPYLCRHLCYHLLYKTGLLRY